jgi:hypothetical protein
MKKKLKERRFCELDLIALGETMVQENIEYVLKATQ